MKKKLAYILSVLLILCMFCGCGEKTDPKTVDYNGKSYDQIAEEIAANSYYVSFLAKNNGTKELSEDERAQLVSQYGFFTDSMFSAAPKWAEIEEEYGICQTFAKEQLTPQEVLGDKEINIVKSGNTLTADIVYQFGNQDVVFQLVYDYYSMKVTSIAIDPVQTMSQKMANAGKNTVISMAIVFAVLVIISLIISCFKIFPYLENRKKTKASANSADVETKIEAAPTPVATQTDDAELIAVIAAAIAASEGTSTSDFVVRSINRR